MATFLYLSIYLPLPNTKEPKFLPIFFGPAFFSSSFFRSAYTVRFARPSAQSWRPTPRRGVSQNGNAKRKSKLKSRTLNLSKKKGPLDTQTTRVLQSDICRQRRYMHPIRLF